MSKLEKYISTNEASYAGNLGFEEMVKFYDKASDDEVGKMEKYLKNDDWDGFKKLIKKVLGVLLK